MIINWPVRSTWKRSEFRVCAVLPPAGGTPSQKILISGRGELPRDPNISGHKSAERPNVAPIRSSVRVETRRRSGWIQSGFSQELAPPGPFNHLHSHVHVVLSSYWPPPERPCSLRICGQKVGNLTGGHRGNGGKKLGHPAFDPSRVRQNLKSLAAKN